MIPVGLRTCFQNMFEMVLPAFTKVTNAKIDHKVKLVAFSAISAFILMRIFQKRWGESGRMLAGRLALKIPFLKKEYDREVQNEFFGFQQKTREKWLPFKLVTELPENSWSDEQIGALLKSYEVAVSKSVVGKHLSGTIYSKSLETEASSEAESKRMQGPELMPCLAATSKLDLSLLAQRLKRLYSRAYEISFLWNSLHSDEFSVGNIIDYQVVRIVGRMFGAKPTSVMGAVTSGGTESLMLAMRAYRNFGLDVKGHKVGESVIIAGDSVHAAIIKASQAYLMRVVLVPTDVNGRIDLVALHKAIVKHKKHVVALVGSAPSYPNGQIDPIQKMGEIAHAHKIGMHVDSCLGAFVINFHKQYNAMYLGMPGVTSLSADTHKNGWGAKGSSVVVTKDLFGRNVMYYSIYAIPEWAGGVYGTPKDAGSQSCTPSLNALVALLAIGKSGYKSIARSILNTTQQLAEIIAGYKGQLQLIGKDRINVVAFKIDPKWGLEKGASYALAYAMKGEGIILNTLKGDAVHFCVTGRFAGDSSALERFQKALEISLKTVAEMNATLKKERGKFPGDAGMYCALDSAMEPHRHELSTGKYLQNLLLGQAGAKDAVRSYFLAHLDPYAGGRATHH